MSSPFRTLAIATLTLGALLPQPAGALPVPGYVYPCSMQAGTKARIIVGGMFMREVNGAVVTGEGVTVTQVKQVPGFPRAPGKTQIPWLKEWFADILNGDLKDRELPPEAVEDKTDWQVCDWWTHLNKHDRLELEIISRFWFTPENYPQPTPALDQQVILDIEVAATARPGLRQLMVHDAHSISAPHPFFITAEPHLAEPSFVIPTNGLEKIRVPDVLHLPCKLPVRKPPVVMDGQVWAGEVDEFRLALKKGVRYTFETVARELQPYLGDAVPGFFNPVVELADPEGRKVAVEDDFHYLPDPILSYVPTQDGVHTFRIYDNLYRGRADFVYTVRCFPDSLCGHGYTPQERAFACFPPPAAHRPPAADDETDVRHGVIDCPGRTERHVFTVKEPTTLSFELFARRAGSPLDGVLRLYGPLADKAHVASAPLLAEWDDLDKFLAGTVPQAISDPCGGWTFLTPGEYALVVADRNGLGGAAYSYDLAIARRRPDFEICATHSSFLLTGNAVTIPVKVVRHGGYAGDPEIEDNEFFRCGEFVMTDEKGNGSFTAHLKKPDWKGLGSARFFARTPGPDGKMIRREMTPADPAEQAFAYTHYVPQTAFRFYRPAPKGDR